MASDAAILCQVDVPRLLSRIPQFYWRGRIVRDLTDTQPTDPDVLNGAIQAFGIFGETQEMLRLTESGRRLLTNRQHARQHQQPALLVQSKH